MPDEPPDPTNPPAVMDIDRYSVLAKQGAMLVGLLNFFAAGAISGAVMAGTWVFGVDMAYRAASLVPAAFATLLASFLGPKIWRWIVVDELQFSPAKGALAGVLTVVLVHIATVEVFLIASFGSLWWFEPGFPYADELPGLILMAPVLSLSVIGRFTLPVGTAIAAGVAVYCQKKWLACHK